MFRSGFFPPGPIGLAAISAIDIALWDIKAQALDVPLYQLLGGLVRDSVDCYTHISGRDQRELIASAQARVAEGWRCLRFDPRPEADQVTFEPRAAVDRCVADFTALREAVGADVELCVDVHTRLDTVDAIDLCRRLEPLRPYFVEDPIRSENPSSFRKLAQHVAVPLAAGEQFATKWAFRELIEEELIDFARIDLCIVGGLTEALKVAGWCETHSIRIAPHNPLGPVATAACLHLDLACSQFGVQELPRAPGTYLQDLFPLQVPFLAGKLLPPTHPGLGVQMNEAIAKRCALVGSGNAPQFRRRDGSFINW